MNDTGFRPPPHLLPRIGSKGLATFLEEGRHIRTFLSHCAPPPCLRDKGPSSRPEPLGLARLLRRALGLRPSPWMPTCPADEPWPPAGTRILDFGCGVGRLLHHLQADDRGYDLWGCDIDAPSIEWLKTRFAASRRVFVNPTEPPLKLPADVFDVVFSFSVFTHIPVGWEAWMTELGRVLRPGGIAMISFQGPTMFGEHVGDPAILEQAGFHVDGADNPWEVGGPQVYQTDAWIAANWSRFLPVRAIFRVGLGGKQSLAVLQKPPLAATEPPLIRLPFLHEVPDPDWTTHVDFDPLHCEHWWVACGWTEGAELGGWFLPRRAPLAAVTATTSGGQPVAVRRVERQDVAASYPDVPWAGRGGFVLSRSDLPPGVDTLTLGARDESGAVHSVEFQTCA